jgi:cytochrome c-type biogenesis protein
MSLGIAIVAMFGSGIAAAISPCVLPLLPGYVGALAAADRRQRWVNVAVFGMTVAATFAVFGAVIGAVGGRVASAAAALRVFAGIVLIALAVGSLASRGRLKISHRLQGGLGRLSSVRVFALGLGCAVTWTPCTGPLLGAALTSAASQGSAPRAAVLLAGYAVGTLTPLLGLAAMHPLRVPSWIRVAGRRTASVIPVLVLILGLLLITDRYDDLIGMAPML